MNNGSELIYKIALSLLDGINAPFAKAMEEAGLSCCEFFSLSISEITRVAHNHKISQLMLDNALRRAEEELKFNERHSIRTLYLTDDDYPPLLREIPDAPVVLYVLGNGNLATVPSIGVVGTRRCTSYGLNFCQQFVSGIASALPGSSIVSGLAYGIDAAAHNAALVNNLPTFAIVAHGLDMIYPAAHRDLARRIVEAGGAIATEFPTHMRPLQGNFLKRNRIIAGLSEMIMVVESEVKGGAMSTASSAFSYSREVVALPGRYTDISSSGCNLLIQQQKANIFTSVGDVIKLMGWKPVNSETNAAIEKSLFPELEDDAAKIYTFLREKAAPQSIDLIHIATGIPMPNLMSTLAELEFEGLIAKVPGNRYELS